MKKLFVIFIVLLFAIPAFGFKSGDEGSAPDKEKAFEGVCPTTKVKGKVDDCKTCHTLIDKDGKISWGLKEVKPFTEFTPPNGATFKIIAGEIVGWYDFDYVEDSQVREVIEYFYQHGTKKLIMNVDSYGGSAFDGYSIVSVIGSYAGKIEVITRAQSIAMSAGFLVFAAGHKRVVSPLATLMWHEISYWVWLTKITPSNSEQEAKIMRLLQDMANEYLASRSNVSKKRIDAEIANKNWFMSGKQALEMGFADELLVSPLLLTPPSANIVEGK